MKLFLQLTGGGRKVPTSALLLLGAASIALIVAGCGGGSKSSGKTSTPYKTPTAATSATLSLGKTDLGKILVGTRGRTLYLFEKDKGPMSTCNGACASAWPPFTASGKPKAGSGVDAAKLSTTKRSDGKQQIVYASHPLYYYAGDDKAGDTNGEGHQAVRRRVVRGLEHREEGREGRFLNRPERSSAGSRGPSPHYLMRSSVSTSASGAGGRRCHLAPLSPLAATGMGRRGCGLLGALRPPSDRQVEVRPLGNPKSEVKAAWASPLPAFGARRS